VAENSAPARCGWRLTSGVTRRPEPGAARHRQLHPSGQKTKTEHRPPLTNPLGTGRRRGQGRVRIRWLALRAVNRLRRRAPASGLDRVRTALVQLAAVHARRLDLGLAAGQAVLNWLLDALALLLCIRAVGAAFPGLVPLVLTYAAGMTAASITIVPGGNGARHRRRGPGPGTRCRRDRDQSCDRCRPALPGAEPRAGRCPGLGHLSPRPSRTDRPAGALTGHRGHVRRRPCRQGSLTTSPPRPTGRCAASSGTAGARSRPGAGPHPVHPVCRLTCTWPKGPARASARCDSRPEVIGVVDSVGPGTQRFAVGNRIGCPGVVDPRDLPVLPTGCGEPDGAGDEEGVRTYGGAVRVVGLHRPRAIDARLKSATGRLAGARPRRPRGRTAPTDC
jgi:hypothetical protein